MKLNEIKKQVLNESVDYTKFPDLIKGNDDLIWVKMKFGRGVVNYEPFYKGHSIDYGGHNFNSIKNLKSFIGDYILSNSLYNNLRYNDSKPLPKTGKVIDYKKLNENTY